MRFAVDDDEAYRVRIVNGACLIALVVQLGLVGLGLVNGDAGHIMRSVPLVGTASLTLLFNAVGWLRFARVAAVLVMPVVLLGMVGAGFARRGTAMTLTLLPLIPIVLFARPSPRVWIPAGFGFAGLGAAATYVGLVHPVVPDLPSAQLPVVMAVISFTSVAMTTVLSWLLVWRQRRISQALEQALERSERAAQTREALLSAVSHELRTPAAAALALLEQIPTEPLPDPTAETLRLATNAVRGEIDRLGDLIDLVSLRTHELRLDPRPFDLARTIRRALQEAQGLAEERGLRFDIDTPRSGWRHGDPERLGQILRHLADNAVRFTESGGVSVEARTWGEAEVELVVRDTGPGLAAEAESRVFEAFAQHSTGHDRTHDGLGLGLTLVRALVQSMQGAIDIETAPGQGTTFRVRLQLPAAAPPVVDPSVLRGRRVLVVDDLALNRRILTRVAERMGAETVEAVDGRDAVDQWRAHRPDLVLMDMQMPVVDGLEATRRIRRAGGRVPVLAVTANATPDAERACLGAGMDAYLTKPVRTGDILHALTGVSMPAAVPDLASTRANDATDPAFEPCSQRPDG